MRARHPHMSAETGRGKASMKAAFHLIREYRASVLLAVLLSVLSSAFWILGPKLLGGITTSIYNSVIAEGPVTIDFSVIAKSVSVLVVLYLCSALFKYLQGDIMIRIAHRSSKKLREELARKIDALPLRYFDKTSHGEILSTVINDIDTVNQSLSQSLPEIVNSLVLLIGILILMFSISWQMAIAALIIVPLAVLISVAIVKKSQKHFIGRQKSLAALNSHVEEMISNHTVVKAFRFEEESKKKFETQNDALFQASWRSQFLSGMLMPMMTVIVNIGYVVVCFMGASLAILSMISVGDIQAFLQYLRNFHQPVTNLAGISNMLQQTAAASARITDFLNEEEEAESPFDEDPEQIQGNIVFEDVLFGYEPDKPVIKHFSATFQKGDKIAIVGPTGAGKTTLVKLLLRYYDVDAGRILIDGIDIKNFQRSKLRSKFTIVLQDTWLFNGSIMENIRYGNLEASDETVIEASKQANADAFIRALPHSYLMELNEESTNLSEGQKQLITIARALLSDAGILILDEATSSVDTRTELHIQEAMDRLMKDKTTFVIAHRLSTIRNSDCILVMDQGNVIEQGTHEELIHKDTFYAKLYKSQFEQENP
ncbi:MAG: ABC transporter ATP-binding protein [Bacillota bacterium]|nr:ABC transporter ATP-binding protein [Bacillota bacterium]